MKIYALDSSIAGLDVSMQDIGIWYNEARILGVPEEIIMKGISEVRDWARTNNIMLPLVPNEQNRIDREYQEKLSLQQENSLLYERGLKTKKENFDEKLIRMGIPPEVIIQGKNALESYASENHIALPTGEGVGGLNIIA